MSNGPVCPEHNLPVRMTEIHPLYGLCPLCYLEMPIFEFGQLLQRYKDATAVMQRAMTAPVPPPQTQPEKRIYESHLRNPIPRDPEFDGDVQIYPFNPPGGTAAPDPNTVEPPSTTDVPLDHTGDVHSVLPGSPEPQSPDSEVPADGD